MLARCITFYVQGHLFSLLKPISDIFVVSFSHRLSGLLRSDVWHYRDAVKITISSTQVLVLPYHSKSSTYQISYVVYFISLRVLCCCISGGRPTVTHMDIVMNVDTRSCSKLIRFTTDLQADVNEFFGWLRSRFPAGVSCWTLASAMLRNASM